MCASVGGACSIQVIGWKMSFCLFMAVGAERAASTSVSIVALSTSFVWSNLRVDLLSLMNSMCACAVTIKKKAGEKIETWELKAFATWRHGRRQIVWRLAYHARSHGYAE